MPQTSCRYSLTKQISTEPHNYSRYPVSCTRSINKSHICGRYVRTMRDARNALHSVIKIPSLPALFYYIGHLCPLGLIQPRTATLQSGGFLSRSAADPFGNRHPKRHRKSYYSSKEFAISDTRRHVCTNALKAVLAQISATMTNHSRTSFYVL